jgi:hypothetical protein
MKNNFFKLAAFALLLAGTVSCEEKDTESLEQKFLMQLQSAPFQEMSENESFPKWLLSMIEEIENNPPTVCNAKIYRGEWEKQTVYLEFNSLNSCFLCEMYYESGSKIMLSDEKIRKDFFSTSQNWTIVYKYGYDYGTMDFK